jgi:hypothetical protein
VPNLKRATIFHLISFGHTLQTLPNITRRLSDSLKIKFHTSDTN